MNKSLIIEDFGHKSLDEIIELYRSGYSLDINYQSQQQLHQTQSLQLSTSTVATIGTIFVTGVVAGMITLLLVKKYEKPK